VTDLSSEKGLAHPIGELFNIIGYGINTMPGYRSQIPVEDRWAIVAYVKALQFSQSVDVAEIPAEEKQRLESMEKPSSSEDGSTATPEEGR
jgi:mono/diheme cytochrome c family protein